MAKALVTIAGVDLPTPSTYTGTVSTIVDAARNVEGSVIGAVVREDVAKVELSWRYLPASTWSTVLKMFNSSYGGSFYNSVTFLDQVSNNWITRDMYVGDRTSSGAFRTDPVTGRITGYVGPKLSLIEV